jgi:hypothetical protein
MENLDTTEKNHRSKNAGLGENGKFHLEYP